MYAQRNTNRCAAGGTHLVRRRVRLSNCHVHESSVNASMDTCLGRGRHTLLAEGLGRSPHKRRTRDRIPQVSPTFGLFWVEVCLSCSHVTVFAANPCTVPAAPANGASSPASGTVASGSSITYTCNTGYQLTSGSSSRLCTTGSLGGTAPVCGRKRYASLRMLLLALSCRR